MKYLQKSFAKGMLSPQVITRQNIAGYDESARELFNVLIDRQGSVYKRGGTAFVANLPKPVSRMVPFKASDKTYLLCFSAGPITTDTTSDLVLAQSIFFLNLEDIEISFKDLAHQYNEGKFIHVYGKQTEKTIEDFKSYWRDVDKGFSKEELKSLDYEQIGNLMVFCSESFPPFYIRKEEDDFVYYRCAMDMVRNGNNSDETAVRKAIKTLPYSYYGYGLSLDRSFVDIYRNNVRFSSYLTLSGNHDTQGLSQNNLKFWRNRAFILTTSNTDNQEINVFNGIIKSMTQESSSAGRPSNYKITGYIQTERHSDLNPDDFLGQSNLYLCDWSNRLGWPRSVTSFENRLLFFSNDAFPAKMWYSAQPGIQRVPVGTKTEISKETEFSEEARTLTNLYKTLYFDQLDLFNLDVLATGLLPQQASSAGGAFINDKRGYTGYWAIGGDKVVYFGTNIGIFTSLGTLTSQGNPIPFNSGFKLFEHPCKRVFPILINELLYFISEDNSVQILPYSQEQGGFTTESLDSFSKDIIRDVTSRSTVTERIVDRDFTEPERIEQKTILAKRVFNADISNPDSVYFDDEDRKDYFLETGVSTFKEPFNKGLPFQDHFLFQTLIAPFSESFSGLDEDQEADILKVDTRLKNIYNIFKNISGDPSHSFTIDFMPLGYFIETHAGELQGGNDFVRSTLYTSFLKRKGLQNNTLPDVTFNKGGTKSLSSTQVQLPSIGEILDTPTIRYEYSSRIKTASITVTQPPRIRLTSSKKTFIFDTENRNLFLKVGGRLDNDDELILTDPIIIEDNAQLESFDFGWLTRDDAFDDIWDNTIYLLAATTEAEANKGKFFLWPLKRDSSRNDRTLAVYPEIRPQGVLVENLRYFRTLLTKPNVISVSGGTNYTIDSWNDIEVQSSIHNSYLTKVTSFFNTYLIGKIDNGYLENNKLSNLNPFKNTRLCGINKLSKNALRLYFNRNQLNITNLFITDLRKTQPVSDIDSISEGNVFFYGEISGIKGSERNLEYGSDLKRVYYIDIILTKDIEESGGLNFKIINYNPLDKSIKGECNIRLQDKNGIYQMRDSLLNVASGEYEIVVGNAKLYDELDQSLDYPDGIGKLKQWYKDQIVSIYEDLTILYGNESDLSEITSLKEGIVLGEITSRNKEYPVFNSNTRMVFDWIHRILYLFREGHPYLAYTRDTSTKVAGWSRGVLNYEDILFIDSLKHTPPEHFSTLFCVRERGLYMLTKGLLSRSDYYIKDLPNCLDDHIIFNLNLSQISFLDTANYVELRGYTDEDMVTIATDKGVIVANKKLKEIREMPTQEGIEGKAFIVGKPFTFIFSPYHPLLTTRAGSLLGTPFTVTQTIFNTIRSSEILENNKFVPEIQNTQIEKYGYGTAFVKVGVQTVKDFDPILEFKGNNPFPFAIGGYILDVSVANS